MAVLLGPKHRQILAQYGWLERLCLTAVTGLRRGVARGIFYLESKVLLDEAIERGFSVTRIGDRNVFEGVTDTYGAFRLTLRRHTSDFIVFSQCLIEQHYAPVARIFKHCWPTMDARIIVDAGANIGLSSLYLSRMFPTACVVALEADRRNYELCAANLRDSQADRVVVLHRALWNEPARLVVGASEGDRRAWALSVRPLQAHNGSAAGLVDGVDIQTVLDERGESAIDILKIDIEGAEKTVFQDAAAVDAWLPKVRCIAIEIHDEAGADLILPQLQRHGFYLIRRGELTIGVRVNEASSVQLLEYFRLEPMLREFMTADRRQGVRRSGFPRRKPDPA